jgi:RecG-like helicase
LNPVLIENLGLVIIDEQHKFGVAQRETTGAQREIIRICS